MPQNKKPNSTNQISPSPRPGLKHTKIGWLPVEWEVVRLREVCKMLSGGTPSKSNMDYWDGEIPWFSAKDLKRFNLTSSIDYISEEGAKNGTRLVAAGTILVLVRGMMLNRDLPIGIVRQASTFNQDIKGLVPFDFMNADFLASYLLVIKGKILSQMNRSSHGTGKLETSNLVVTPIPLPPLKEQTAIATCLSTWDRAITTTRNLLEQLENRKKGLMQRLLTGEVRLPGFSSAAAASGGEGEWETTNFGELFNERRETGFDNLELLSIGQNGVYPQEQSNKKDTSNSNKSKYKRICPNDIGYNTMRMWQGRSAISTVEGIVSPAYTILKPKKNANPEFFIYLFHTHPVIHKFFQYSQGLVSDTWQCKFKDFAKIKALLPTTYKEQTAIAKVLTAADKEITLYKEKLATLETQKRGLMQQLLTGQKRLQA